MDLNSDIFRDKVLGCWSGKNCGGTLGAPLEKIWGEPEPFDTWWYPELREGGIPNDDLEMQLIWLKALEEVGPELRAADLARYWLAHIGYNWDEYGQSKTNLRLGLMPPVSGYYNNLFRDCMGCPIRSEIWACIAPGNPRLAVRYAYEDAICDHAGGESIYGEMFNTAIQSAAFVISDPIKLLDIGRSYVKKGSATAIAVDAALDAWHAGLTWQEARKRVLEATPHENAQYSPINIAFQVIGWLWGADFGDAICKAVNCGYDTDCTGATLGAVLGIIEGRSGLPDRWTEPLGDDIATNESWGGLRHASNGSNPVPKDLHELTTRVIRMAERIRSHFGLTDRVPTVSELYADASVYALWELSPTRVPYSLGFLDVAVEYLGSPVIEAGVPKRIITEIINTQADPIAARCDISLPSGWTVEPVTAALDIPAHGTAAIEWEITVESPRDIAASNRLSLTVTPHGYPAQPSAPIVLIGASRYRVSGLYKGGNQTEEALLAQAFAPEELNGSIDQPASRSGDWSTIASPGMELPLSDRFADPGVLYLQAFLWSDRERDDIRVQVSVNCPVRFWLNNEPKASTPRYRKLRPNYDADHDASSRIHLNRGFNELLIKLVRGVDAPPFEGYLILTRPDAHLEGAAEIGKTRLTWDV